MIKNKSPEVAQEIEFLRKGKFINFLKPEKNNLSGILKNRDNQVLLQDTFPKLSLKQIETVKWSSLDYSIRNKILNNISTKVDYSKNRSIPYLIAVSKIKITAHRDFEFLGKRYEKDKDYTVNLEGFLHETVEYASKGKIEAAAAIELHFRGTKPSEMNKNIEIFFDDIVPSVKNEKMISPVSSHQHIVGVRPSNYFNKMKKEGYDKETIALGLTLTHQLFENSLILINAVRQEFFPMTSGQIDYLRRDKAKSVYDFFIDLQSNKVKNIETQLKKNNVGVRNGNTYSDNSLWGFELRFGTFEITLGTQEYLRLADTVKQSVENQEFPVNLSDLTEFMKVNKVSHRKLSAESWWVQDLESLSLSHQKGYLSMSKLNKLLKNLKTHYRNEGDPILVPRDNYDARMMLSFIFYRWDRNPLFFKEKKLLISIQKFQTKLLDELNNKINVEELDSYKLSFLVERELNNFLLKEELSPYKHLKKLLNF